MKGYTQIDPPNSAGNRPDPCPFHVHICTCYEAGKCVVKERRREAAIGVYPSQRDRLELEVSPVKESLSIEEIDIHICICV